MEKIEFKGKNVEDALSIAAKHFKTNIENIDYDIIEESNKTLFSILSPKYAIIKAKMIDESKVAEQKTETKTEYKKQQEREYKIIPLTQEQKGEIEKKINDFLEEFSNSLNIKIEKSISFDENDIVILKITGDEAGILIGYRGEILDSLQVILRLVTSNYIKKYVKIQLDIAGYREKRKETLEGLANRIAVNVVRNRKSVTLEPMVAYERKIIHNALQQNDKIETKSIGEEPYRRVVVSLKK